MRKARRERGGGETGNWEVFIVCTSEETLRGRCGWDREGEQLTMERVVVEKEGGGGWNGL